MIIYFLIENVDVDRCHHDVVCLVRAQSGAHRSRYVPRERRLKKEGKSLPKGVTLTTMQYSPPHSSVLRVGNGRKKNPRNSLTKRI